MVYKLVKFITVLCASLEAGCSLHLKRGRLREHGGLKYSRIIKLSIFNTKNMVIEWLKEYFDRPDLNEESMRSLLHFSLLWNMFEHSYFTDTNRLTVERLKSLASVSQTHLSQDETNYIYDFFKNRYFPQNKEDPRFRMLMLSKENHECCQEIFVSTTPSHLEKIEATLLIIHRFRNNLFHGRKNPKTLNIYEEPFAVINRFLIHFLQNTAENQSVNVERFN